MHHVARLYTRILQRGLNAHGPQLPLKARCCLGDDVLGPAEREASLRSGSGCGSCAQAAPEAPALIQLGRRPPKAASPGA